MEGIFINADNITEAVKFLVEINENVGYVLSDKVSDFLQPLNQLAGYGIDYTSVNWDITDKLSEFSSQLDDAIKLAKKTAILAIATDSGVPVNEIIEGFSRDGYDWMIFGIDDLGSIQDGKIDLSNDIKISGTLDKTLSVNPDVYRDVLYIYKYCTFVFGYTHEGAMAVLNNIAAESQLRPVTNLDDTGPTGSVAFGLCQWLNTGGKNNRRANLYDYCSNNNLDPESIDGQLEFMNHELKEKYNNKSNKQLNLYDQLTGKSDYNGFEISKNFTKVYECPVDENDPDYYTKNNRVAENRYYSYNNDIEAQIDINDMRKESDEDIEVLEDDF